jgi:hypothetical protein
LNEDLALLLSVGEGPERLIPAFLHEATHHWCYNSPVGLALTTLQLRIHRAAATAKLENRSDAISTLAQLLTRYETAVAFLRPLDEGMALFAEFDLKTRQESKSWSEPIALAAQFFAKPGFSAENPELFIVGWAQLVFQRMRLGQSSIERKVDVLGGPLRCDGDAYLPGYLLVRRLWLEACKREWRLANETDLFLMYLRSFVYDDMGLVATLLDGALDEIRGPGEVANHILGRLEQFTKLDGADVEQFDQAVAEDESIDTRRTRILSTLKVNEDTIRRGEARLHQALADYQDDEGQTQDPLRLHEKQVLMRRQLLYVGSWPVEVEVTGGRYKVTQGGSVIREGVAVKYARDGTASGHIDVLQWVAQRERVCAVIRNGEVVAAESPLRTKESNDPDLLALIGERDEARQRLIALDRVVEEVSDETWAHIAVDHIRAQTPDRLNSAYLPIALWDVPFERMDATVSLMKDNGLFPLFDYERTLIEGLAALSICCSTLGPQEQLIAAFLEHRGLNLERTMAATDNLYARHGVARVWREDGYLLSSV